jgi:hypothetical protein
MPPGAFSGEAEAAEAPLEGDSDLGGAIFGDDTGFLSRPRCRRRF